MSGKTCRDGGIGRRRGLKILRPRGRTGSSPVPGTNDNEPHKRGYFCFARSGPKRILFYDNLGQLAIMSTTRRFRYEQVRKIGILIGIPIATMAMPTIALASSYKIDYNVDSNFIGLTRVFGGENIAVNLYSTYPRILS